MDFGLSESQRKLIAEVDEFLDGELTADIIHETELCNGWGPNIRKFMLKLGARRWLAATFPAKYGGMDTSHIEHLLIYDQVTYRGGPGAPIRFIGAAMAGPTLLKFGSEEQKQRYLPRIASGEIEFALGYTEPDAGSDLANLSLRAENKGDYYLLNGSKIFNTHCHCAEYHWLAARTKSEGSKHRGISIFIVDLQSPGITIEPIWTLADWRTNRVYYDDVRVPKENLVGEENRGWTYLMSALDEERVTITGHLRRRLERLLMYVKEKGDLRQNMVVRHRLSELSVELEIGRLLSY